MQPLSPIQSETPCGTTFPHIATMVPGSYDNLTPSERSSIRASRFGPYVSNISIQGCRPWTSRWTGVWRLTMIEAAVNGDAQKRRMFFTSRKWETRSGRSTTLSNAMRPMLYCCGWINERMPPASTAAHWAWITQDSARLSLDCCRMAEGISWSCIGHNT